MTIRSWQMGAVGVAMAAVAAVWSGCEVGTPNETIRNTTLQIAGYYANGEGKVVSQNTGARILWLNLRQTGDSLEAVDNNGMVFRGTIGSESTSAASITLSGPTTAGNKGTISATVTTSGTAAEMRGTWIEDTTYGVVQATATVPAQTNGNSGTGLTITPAGTITMAAAGSSRTFTASGGTAPYAWARSSTSIGTLSATTGSSVTYTASGTGQQTITVTDSASASKSTIINQN